MINDSLCADILDVLHYQKPQGKTATAARSFHALSFRMEANGYFLTENGKIPARTGDIAYVPSGISYTVAGAQESILVIHFYAVNNPGKEISVIRPAHPEHYRALFAEALTCWERKEPGYRYRAAAILYTILADLTAEHAQENTEQNEPIRRAAQRMQRCFDDPGLTVHALAADCYMSDALFRRKFRAIYGMSPKQYLEELRFRHAAALLEAGYFSQAEIAARCGFSDVKYFRHAFKAYYGKTVSDYKYNFSATE